MNKYVLLATVFLTTLCNAQENEQEKKPNISAFCKLALQQRVGSNARRIARALIEKPKTKKPKTHVFKISGKYTLWPDDAITWKDSDGDFHCIEIKNPIHRKYFLKFK